MSEQSPFDSQENKESIQGAEQPDAVEKSTGWKARIKNFGGAILDKVAAINGKLSGAGYLEHIEQARVEGKAAQVRQLRESQTPPDWEADQKPDFITYPPAVLGHDIAPQGHEASAPVVTITDAQRVAGAAAARLNRRPGPGVATSANTESRSWLDEPLVSSNDDRVGGVLGARPRAARHSLPGGKTATVQRVTRAT